MLTPAERDEAEKWKEQKRDKEQPTNPHLIAWRKMQARLAELGVRDQDP